MDKSNVKWLYAELPKLIEKDIVSEESSNKIKAHYGKITEESKSNLLLTIFGVFGAFLIASGIILILAKNWDIFPRSTRVFIGFLPLIIGQLLVVYTYFKKMGSLTWKEATSAFLYVSIGTTISIVSQAYNISGDFNSFVLSWMLLGVPLVYLFSSIVSTIIYIFGITIWSINQNSNGLEYFYFALLAIISYLIFKLLKEKLYSSRAAFVCWALSISLTSIITNIAHNISYSSWIIIMPTFFVFLYILGTIIYKEDNISIWAKPFKFAGIIGSVFISYLLSSMFVWINFNSSYNYMNEKSLTPDNPYIYAIFSIAIALSIFAYIYKNKIDLLYSLLIPISLAAYSLSIIYNNNLGVILFNLYLFSYSLFIIVKGIVKQNLSNANVGMLLLSIQIISRFFDGDISTLIKGLTFIFIGIGFFLANWTIIRKRRVITQ